MVEHVNSSYQDGVIGIVSTDNNYVLRKYYGNNWVSIADGKKIQLKARSVDELIDKATAMTPDWTQDKRSP